MLSSALDTWAKKQVQVKPSPGPLSGFWWHIYPVRHKGVL